MAVTPTTAAPVAVGRRSLQVGLLAAGVVLVLLIPVLTPTVFLNVVSRTATFALVALSMNVLLGYAGQVSLGHNAFMGIGAFAAGYLLTEVGLPWELGLIFAALTGGLAALVLGGVALRIRGLYLALVTLAYGVFAEQTIFNIRAVTGGGAGMPAPRPGWGSGDMAYAYICLVAVALALAFDWRLTSSRAGRAIMALRDNERVAASWGMNVTWYKLLAFVISGAMAGIAGGLFASIEQVVVAPDFPVTLSLTFLLMAVLGGLGSRWGVLQAGVFIAVLPSLLDWANDNIDVPPFTAIDGSVAPLFVAVLVLLTLVFFPGGLAQVQRPLWRRLAGTPREGGAQE